MKKICFWLLIIIIIFSLRICSKKEGLEIGKTYTSNGVEFTINYIDFTNNIDNLGGANDNYWKPIPDDANRNQIENAQTPKSSDNTIFVISYTAKNISKGDKRIDDIGKLDFDNGYTYLDGNLSYRVSPTGVWCDIPSGLILEKLKEKSYEFRAYMIVPKVVAESKKPLTYTLFGQKFNLR